MFRTALVLVLFVAASLCAGCATGGVESLARVEPSAQNRKAGADAFLQKTHAGKQGGRMSYLLFVPDNYDPRKKYPLVLWLHGGGSRGDDLRLILSHGDKHGPLFIARPDNQAAYPSFVVAPQCPAGRIWSDPQAETPTVETTLVLEILDALRAEYSVDDRRLYVLGISMGGYAAWDIITRRPGAFAAAVPVCGGGEESRASLMKGTAVWAFHGEKDEAVSVSESRRMVAALRKAGGPARYTEYAGVGHNSWERAFQEPVLLSWLFAQSRGR